MYHHLYAEMVDDSPKKARETERAVLETAIKKLAVAKTRGARSPEAFEATHFLRHLWSIFIKDLSGTENALPESLRASLISIGLWIQREADLIDSGKSTNFDGLIEVNQMIADGLA
jgi:flagellar biosynthesis activator protein FlaF